MNYLPIPSLILKHRTGECLDVIFKQPGVFITTTDLNLQD
jgi:hypothetical protein